MLELIYKAESQKNRFSFIFLIRDPKLGNVPKVTASSWRSQDLNLGLLTLDSITIYPFLIWTSCQNVGSQPGWSVFCTACLLTFSAKAQYGRSRRASQQPYPDPERKEPFFFSHAQMSEAIWNPGLRKRSWEGRWRFLSGSLDFSGPAFCLRMLTGQRFIGRHSTEEKTNCSMGTDDSTSNL